jgi:hypothetical protein
MTQSNFHLLAAMRVMREPETAVMPRNAVTLHFFCGSDHVRGRQGAKPGYFPQPGATLLFLCRTRLQCQPGWNLNPCPQASV